MTRRFGSCVRPTRRSELEIRQNEFGPSLPMVELSVCDALAPAVARLDLGLDVVARTSGAGSCCPVFLWPTAGIGQSSYEVESRPFSARDSLSRSGFAAHRPGTSAGGQRPVGKGSAGYQHYVRPRFLGDDEDQGFFP